MTLEHLFCERSNDGITVRLFWNPANLVTEFLVTVSDARTGDDFTIEPENGEAAIAAFHHPFSARLHVREVQNV